ncbi:MAG: hypothetical protein K0R73_884 [Candidatus Midichloriaceae bacterium]|jgi:hypothetical protein|nr:hypothetical protein [Candidatus Midichloriaceae bacterium]
MLDFGKVRWEKAVKYFTYLSIFYQANLAKGER